MTATRSSTAPRSRARSAPHSNPGAPAFLLTLALLVSAPVLPAPAGLDAQQASDPSGHWEGTIQLPGQELAFDVDLVLGEGTLTGDISIPAQGARDLALAGLSQRGDSLTFAISGVPGEPTFHGVLDEAGDRVEGTFTQGGQSFPFSMSRGEVGARAEAAAAEAAATLDGLGEWLTGEMEKWRVPGMALGVVKDGEVVLAEGFGVRDAAAQLPVTPHTLFAIGSSTKAFTTFAVGTLVDDGLVAWDTPVREYLPTFTLHDPYATLNLSPRDLVTHRSGLPRHDLSWYNNPEFTPEVVVTRLGAFEPTYGLRERFQYNNLMYATAGHLVAELTGTSWEGAIRDRILEPLGMDETNFSVQESQAGADFARGYGEEDDTLIVLPFRDITNIGPAGSINSNVDDMTRWLRVHLERGEFEGRRLIEGPTLAEMHTPQIAISQMPSDPALGPLTYGLGWFVDSYRGHYRVQHGGNIDGFSALVTLYPFDGVGVVALSNKNGTPLPEFAARRVADLLFELEPRDWSSEALTRRDLAQASAEEGEEREEEERVTGTRPAHPLPEYAGAYEHPGYGTLQVEHEGEGLQLRYNRIEAPLEHWHYDVFQVERQPGPGLGGMKVQFLTGVDGGVTAVSVPFEPSLDRIVFERAPDRRLEDPAYLQRFVGEYELSGQRVRVALRGERLTVTVPGQPTYTLDPLQDDEFALQGLEGYRLAFRSEGGTVVEAIFRQPNGTFVARRIEPAGA